MSILTTGFALRAMIAALAVGFAAPVIGSFLVQRKLSLIGDGMGHLAFAGVALGVLLGVSPILGALVVAILGGVALERLRSRGRLASDLSLALIFYAGIALGLVVLSTIGKMNLSAMGVLFGSILTATAGEVAGIVAMCALVAGVTALLYKEFLAASLDEEMARASGLPVDALNLAMLVLTALLVAAGMRVVGLLLVAALLVIPVAAGSRLAHSFRGAMWWGIGIGGISALAGLLFALLQGTVAPGGTIVLGAILAYVASAAAGRRIARFHTREPKT